MSTDQAFHVPSLVLSTARTFLQSAAATFPGLGGEMDVVRVASLRQAIEIPASLVGLSDLPLCVIAMNPYSMPMFGTPYSPHCSDLHNMTLQLSGQGNKDSEDGLPGMRHNSSTLMAKNALSVPMTLL